MNLYARVLAIIMCFYPCQEHHYRSLHYEIPQREVSLDRIFGKMERAKVSQPVEEYSVTQNTLDNVRYTREQVHVCLTLAE